MTFAKLSALGAAAVLMLGLSACSTSAPAPAPAPAPTAEPIPSPVQLSEKYTNENMFEAKKKLSDGRTVTCVVYHEYQEGGVSCDWESAVKQHGK